MKGTLAIILAGGRGSRIDILSQKRVKPSVPFGGKYRIIDFTLSNCANSGIYDIGILTQYLPLSLNEHIGNGKPWDLDRRDSKVTLLQPHSEWYQGTADAVKKNLAFVERNAEELVLILSGDHIYKMDYREVINQHIETGAELTVCAKVVPIEEASRFGILETNEDLEIEKFVEKPADPKSNYASMGIYVFNKDVLLEMLNSLDIEDLDFGKHIIPEMIGKNKVYAFPFTGYWKDVGTYDSYLEASLELTRTYDENVIDMYDPNWKFYTRSEDLPAVKVSRGANIKKSLLSNGTVVSGRVERSILSPGVIIHPNATVINSVLLNGVRVREGAYIENSIIDKRVDVGENSVIGSGVDYTPNVERPDLLESGINVIEKWTKIPADSMIERNCRIFKTAKEEDLKYVKSGSTIR